MQVEVDPDIGVSVKTVGERRKVTVWPENLAIMTPPEYRPGSTIKVSKATVATRVSPKTIERADAEKTSGALAPDVFDFPYVTLSKLARA
jgi:hypothetical protein